MRAKERHAKVLMFAGMSVGLGWYGVVGGCGAEAWKMSLRD
jgi:hypothetical protein